MGIIFKRFDQTQFQGDAGRLMTVTGILAAAFMGIQGLLKVLYVLRLGYGLEYIGFFTATGAFTYMLMSLPSGMAGSRWGTSRAMFWGGSITVVGMAILPLTELLPLAGQQAWPIFTQVVLSVGWALFTVNLVPALMTTTTAQNRNSVYALNSTFRGLGTFVGTIVGGLLPGFFAYLLHQPSEATVNYRWALWMGALLGVVALPLLSRLHNVAGSAASGPTARRGSFPALAVGLIVLHVYLSQGAWATCQVFCNAYMDTDLQLSTVVIGLITGVGQFVAILAPLLTPRLARRYTNGWTLMITTLGTGLSLLPLIVASHWLAVGIGQVGMAALAAIWLPALQIYQMEIVESQWRSLAYGIVSMAMGFTFASVSLIGGYMVAGSSYRSLFLLGVIASLLGALLMWFMQRQPALVAASVAVEPAE